MNLDKCKFCDSTKCHYRIVSIKDQGQAYDEISCRDHMEDLTHDADTNAKGIMKLYHVTKEKVARRDPVSDSLITIEKNSINYNQS